MVHIPTIDLHPSDLCDRCAMQASVNVRLPSGRHLLWCQQHFAVHGPQLTAIGGVVTADHREGPQPMPVRKAS